MTRFRLKHDITRHPDQRYSFTEYMATLDGVFDSVWFTNVTMRDILLDSYRINLWDIALYAIENKIDELEHIQSIKRMLLKTPGCRERY